MPEKNLIRAAVDRLPAVLGNAFGTVVAVQMGDPVTGAVVGEIMAQTGDDFLQRVLSTRQENRVANVIEMAAEEIRRRLDNNQQLRSDGFFSAANPDSAEVTEGVLLAARDEHQEKKMPYLANLYASIAFDPEISVESANLAIRDAERLSWQELRLLAIVQRPDVFPLPDLQIRTGGQRWSAWTASEMFMSLHREGGFLYSPEGATEQFSLPTWDLRLSAVRLNPRGRLITYLMHLDRIPEEEVRPVLADLVEALEDGARRTAERERSASR